MIAKYFIKNWSIYAWYFTIIIGLIITAVPFLWTFAGSFKENDVIFYQVSPFSFKALLPGTSIDAYIGVFEKDFARAILNTLFVSIVSV